MHLGDKFKLVRMAEKKSLQDVSDKLGVTKSTLYRFEIGKEVNYSTGKKIEFWLNKYTQPKECHFCNGSGIQVQFKKMGER